MTSQGKVCFMIYSGGLSPQRLIAFMRQLTRDAQRKVHLVLDNLNVHKAKPVRDWPAPHATGLRVISPDGSIARVTAQAVAPPSGSSASCLTRPSAATR